MAKVTFSKLGLKINQEVTNIHFNEQVIEVKQYIPVNEKLELISRVINNAADDNNFANPAKIDVYLAYEIITNYTNITFTDKQKDDILKIYDSFVSSGLYKQIIDAIPEAEYDQLETALFESVSSIYNYRNSVMGILDTISTDYSNLSLDAENIHNQLSDPANITLLRNVLSKLG